MRICASYERKFLLAIFLVGVSLTLSGCLPTFSGGEATKTEEFSSGRIVRGFPPDIPLYKNAQIVESYGGVGGYGASFIAGDNFAKVVNFYNQSLSVSGWTVSSRQVSETNYVFGIKNEKNAGQVIVNTAADGKKTAISMSISKR